MLLIKNARINGALSCVTVEGGKILSVTAQDPYTTHAPADTVIDGGGAQLFPGLVDIHTHGMRGMDTMDGGNLPALAEAYLAAGTTTVYPTTVTAAADAFCMASRAPAEMLGLSKGLIAPGYDAEFVLVDDEYRLIKAMVL